jgi:dTMP kinase
MIMAMLPDGRALPGKLFIVEGIDGSGKSTQLDMLRKWLISQGYLVAFSEWNSSPIVRRMTRRGKKKQMLTPISFSLVHAADFVDRMERQMLPALKAGAIVLADRYIYTAFGRDVARGVHPEWVREMYSFAIQPTVAFYFRVPLEESLKRILTGRPTLKYYEAGLDIGLHDDPYKSYELFQGRILEEYDQMIDEFNLEVIDATLPLLEQHEIVIETVEGHLEAALRAAQSPWSDVLTSEDLQGRYLTPQASGDQT